MIETKIEHRAYDEHRWLIATTMSHPPCKVLHNPAPQPLFPHTRTGSSSLSLYVVRQTCPQKSRERGRSKVKAGNAKS